MFLLKAENKRVVFHNFWKIPARDALRTSSSEVEWRKNSLRTILISF